MEATGCLPSWFTFGVEVGVAGDYYRRAKGMVWSVLMTC